MLMPTSIAFLSLRLLSVNKPIVFKYSILAETCILFLPFGRPSFCLIMCNLCFIPQ